MRQTNDSFPFRRRLRLEVFCSGVLALFGRRLDKAVGVYTGMVGFGCGTIVGFQHQLEGVCVGRQYGGDGVLIYGYV